MSNEKCEILESRLSDKEKSLADNKKLIINYQLEVNNNNKKKEKLKIAKKLNKMKFKKR